MRSCLAALVLALASVQGARSQDLGTSRPLVPPVPMSYEAFPASSLAPEGMKVLEADLSGQSVGLTVNVRYATKDGRPLDVHVIEPRRPPEDTTTLPLVVYVQGSAWMEQRIGTEFAQLADFARRGFVVAVVQYRPSTLVPFPAQVKDAKSALRFMVEHAAEYRIDPDRVILWGDSSGGHTAVIAGLTLNDDRLTDEAATPVNLRAIVDFYGPTDIARMSEEPSTMDHAGPESPEGMLIGGVNVLENPDLVAPTVAMGYVSDAPVPPVLIIHGDKDRLVPFGQSVLLYEALRDAGKTVEFYKLQGADHGGPAFWTEEVLDIVEAFVRNQPGVRGLALILVAGLTAAPMQAPSHATDLAGFVATARGADVVVLGEVHDNPEHHANQAEIVRALQPAALVFEMIPEAREDAVNALRSTGAGRDEIAETLDWSESGWPDFDLYAPILEAAPDALVYGGARPEASVRAAADGGAAAAFGMDAARFALDRALPEDEQATREADMQASHCDALPEAALPGMVEAQRFRDAVLADAVLRALAATGGPVAAIAGSGHSDRRWGVPAMIAEAEPQVAVIALGQGEGEDGADPGAYDAYLVAPAPDREDPCAAFQGAG